MKSTPQQSSFAHDPLAAGREVERRYVSPFQIRTTDGSLRAILNSEMAAALELTRDARLERRDADQFANALQHWLNQGCPLAPPTESD